jgi:alpha-tubulin suppressor-like RCC1 family protein
MKRLLLTVATLAAVTIPATPTATATAPPAAPVHHLIATNEVDAVVIAGDGQPYGAGANEYGELGGTGVRTTLTRIAGLPSGVRAASVADGFGFVLVLGSDGRAYGSGDNASHQLTGTAATKSALTPLTGLPAGVHAVDVSASPYTSFVVGSNGVLYLSGVAIAAVKGGGAQVSTLTPVLGLPAGVLARQVSAGVQDVVVLGSDHHAYGAGDNLRGELTGSTAYSQLTGLADVPAGLQLTAVSVGYLNVALLDSTGRVWATGANDSGQLGTGAVDSGPHPVPQLVPGLTGVARIAVGSEGIVAVGRDGLVRGTGANDYHQLTTLPTTVTTAAPLRLAPGQPTDAPIVEASSLSTTTLVRDADGVVLATGSESWGVPGGTPFALTALSGQRVLDSVRPAITGKAKVGRTLTAHAGSWSVRPAKYAYQWYRHGTKVSGATKSTYKLTKHDRGWRLSVRITATRPGFATGAATSATTSKIH